MGEEASQPERWRTWDGVVRREIACAVRVLDEAERSIEVIASTEALDSHGDVVKQFWDLSRYNKNGPVLWNHNIHESSNFSFGGAVRPEDTMPIGKGTDVRVESKQLTAKITLVKGSEAEEPFVAKLWRRIQQGVIKAVSVGFRPGQVNRITNASGGTDHFELGSAERPNELREISFVPMGSNPEAVAKSIAWERKHLEDESRAAVAAEESEQPMSMTAEEKKTLDDAVAAKTVAETHLTTEREKAKTLEKDLTAEKAVTAKLTSDLAAANERVKTSDAARARTELDARQAKKFAPTEREELDKLVAEVGLDRTLKLIDARPDLSLTTPVTVIGEDGKAKQLPTGAPAPTPVEDVGDPSAEIVKIANERARSTN
jgi:hypothetical protein